MNKAIISFEEFTSFTDHEDEAIQIRGFLYPYEDHFILTDTPNLKSCCVGTEKTEKQIAVYGLPSDFEAPLSVVLIEGSLSISHGYLIDNAKVISKNNDAALGILGIVCLVIFLCFYIKRSL